MGLVVTWRCSNGGKIADWNGNEMSWAREVLEWWKNTELQSSIAATRCRSLKCKWTRSPSENSLECEMERERG
jgi:hypothetical protein